MMMIMIKKIKDAAKSQCILVYYKISVDNSWMELNWSGSKFIFYRLSIRVSQTSKLLEIYMVVNFRSYRISQDTRKLVQTPILINKKKSVDIRQWIEGTENLMITVLGMEINQVDGYRITNSN